MSSEKVSRRTEVAANAAIVLVAVVASAAMVKHYFLSTSAQPLRQEKQGSVAGPTPGSKISIAGVEWDRSSQTLVLAISTRCHYCTESAPFYRKLAGEVKGRNDLRMVAVFPKESPTESQQYLSKLSVPISDVEQASLGSLGVRGTPTLILVDRNGAVLKSWVGELKPERQEEVLKSIKCDSCS